MNKIVVNVFHVLAVATLLLTVGCKKKEVDMTKAFVKYYGGLKGDGSVQILQVSDGGYVIGGTSNIGTNNSDNYDIIVIKTDAEGNEVWHKTFGRANYDECGTVAIMPDNGYLVIGTYGITARTWKVDALEATKDSTEMVAIRLDANGNKLWEKTYGYSNPSVKIGTFGRSIVVNNDNTCFLGGMVDSSYISLGNTFVNLDLFGLMIDQSGDLIKVGGLDMKPLRYGSDNQPDYMNDAIKAFSSSGDEYLIASSTTLSGQNTPRLVKCRMNGITLTQNNAPSKSGWSTSGAGDLLNSAQICRTADNNYMLTGSSGASLDNSDFYMFKLDGLTLGDGGFGFLKFYRGDAKDASASIIPTNDGGYAILATTNSINFTGSPEKLNDVLLMKVDNAGVQQWHKTFGGNGNDSASKIIQTQDGGYLVCGTISFGEDVSNSGASNSITLIKLNSEGEISNLK